MVDGGPKPFHFEEMWFEVASLLPLLEEWWQVSSVLFFWSKLNGVKKNKIKVWNKEVFGHLENKIKRDMDIIVEIDKKEEFLTIFP